MPVRMEICRMALKHGFRGILDICCGTGAQCIALSRLGLSVAGVDLSPAMLRVARRKSCGQIPFLGADARSLPFPDNSFDGVILSFALHEKDEGSRHRILAEAKRVLKPGGRILIADFEIPTGPFSRAAGALVHLVERCAGKRHYTSFRDFMRLGALGGLLRAHGLFSTDKRFFYFANVSVAAATVSSSCLDLFSRDVLTYTGHV